MPPGLLHGFSTRALTSPIWASRKAKTLQRRLRSAQSARLREAAEYGRSEGSKGIPLPEETGFSDAEKRINQNYAGDLGTIRQLFGPATKFLENEYEAAENKVNSLKNQPPHELSQLRQKILNEQNDLLEEFKKRQKEFLSKTKDALTEAEEGWKVESDRTGRKVRHNQIRRIPYLFMITFIVLGEFPLNSLVFAVFGETRILTFIMAATIAFAIPVIAHITGFCIRQHKDIAHGAMIATILASLTSIGLLAISIIRYLYFQEISDLGLTNSIAFFFINLLIFTGAIALSIFAHDPDLPFEKAYYSLKYARKIYAKSNLQFEQAISAESEKVKQIRENNDRILTTAEAAYSLELRKSQERAADSGGRHDTILEILTGLEERVTALYKACIFEYRLRNKLARSGSTNPAIFGKDTDDEENFPRLELKFSSKKRLCTNQEQPIKPLSKEEIKRKFKIYPSSP